MTTPQIRFSKMSIDDKLRGYDIATPAERKRYELRAMILSRNPTTTVAWQRMSDSERQAIVSPMQEIARKPD